MQSSNKTNNIEIKQEHWSLKHMISNVIQEQEYRSYDNDLISGEIKQPSPTTRGSSSRIKITQRLKGEIKEVISRVLKNDNTQGHDNTDIKSCLSNDDVSGRVIKQGSDEMRSDGKGINRVIKQRGMISKVIKQGQGVIRRIKRKWWALNHHKYDVLGRCFCISSDYTANTQELIFAPRMKYQRLRSSSSNCDVDSNPNDGSNANYSVANPNAASNSDDTVVVNIGIIGDSDTGKTSFMAKYVAVDQSEDHVETIGVAWVEKVFNLQSVNIALSIRDLGGHWRCSSMLPMVCADASAIFIMFDLTRRSTLHSVKEWFVQARECNKAAITVIIGTKYDRFVHLPQEIQIAVIRQARFYAKSMEASLFFSSVTHNINVHKIFKVIVAKVFDLPCNISRNLNLGEPIIDY